jgi:hypothetical protein
MEENLTTQTLSVTTMVEKLLARFTARWWAIETDLPLLGPVYSSAEHHIREKQLERLTNTLLNQAKHPPKTPAERQALQNQLEPQFNEFLKIALGLEDRHIEAIRNYGFIEAATEFAYQARQFDPAISLEDISQACRNVWSMNLMQLLFGLPVEVTPAVFAYSMLYPYTDNYLDDPSVSAETKQAFNQRFRQRLDGKPGAPMNAHEQTIYKLVAMIESTFARSTYPQVYESLLAIHTAQSRSLALQRGPASPYEVDALGICFEKGGTSTLADAYLVAGELTEAQRDFAFYYGCVTQLVDDLEDVESDSRSGIMTIFAQTAGRWPLDTITNRAMHFSMGMVAAMEGFNTPGLEPLKEMLRISLYPLFIDSIGRARRYFTLPYLREVEAHFPFRFDYIYQQRKKLYQHRTALNKLVETLMSER